MSSQITLMLEYIFNNYVRATLNIYFIFNKSWCITVQMASFSIYFKMITLSMVCLITDHFIRFGELKYRKLIFEKQQKAWNFRYFWSSKKKRDNLPKI